jgi:CBS domain-containing protein
VWVRADTDGLQRRGGASSLEGVSGTNALGLCGPQATLRADASAAEAAAMLARVETSAALVLDDAGGLVGILSDEDLLLRLLPGYVGETTSLARVLEEGTAEELWHRLEARTVRDLLVPPHEAAPVVDRDATLIEVASVMVRARVRLVAVVDQGRVVGGITIDHLLSHLVRRS